MKKNILIILFLITVVVIIINCSEETKIIPTAEIEIFTSPYGSSSTDTVLTLYDESEARLSSNDNNADGVYSSISKRLKKGKYYIKVSGAGTNTIGQYILNVNVKDLSRSISPGSTNEDALPIHYLAPQSHFIDSSTTKHWYYFYIFTPMNVVIETYPYENSEVDTKIYLKDTNLNNIAENDNISGTSTFSQISTFLPSGKYFIELESSQLNRYYSIIVRGQGDPIPVDPPATFNEAIPASIGVKHVQALEIEGDEDLFQFNVMMNENYDSQEDNDYYTNHGSVIIIRSYDNTASGGCVCYSDTATYTVASDYEYYESVDASADYDSSGGCSCEDTTSAESSDAVVVEEAESSGGCDCGGESSSAEVVDSGSAESSGGCDCGGDSSAEAVDSSSSSGGCDCSGSGDASSSSSSSGGCSDGCSGSDSGSSSCGGSSASGSISQGCKHRDCRQAKIVKRKVIYRNKISSQIHKAFSWSFPWILLLGWALIMRRKYRKQR